MRRYAGRALPVALLLLGVGAFVSLCVGRYPLAPVELARFAASLVGLGHLAPDRAALIRSIVLESRLPRVFGAILVGGSLSVSVSGASFQAVFRNPLVSPGLLGVLSGAGFGAALGFVLVFGGLVSSALFTSLLSILKYGADPTDQLPAIVFWLLGSLAQIAPDQLLAIAAPLCLGMLLLCMAGRRLDALAMGDDEARTLGVPVAFVRYGVIALATIVSALTVSVAGMIGWVGLIIPHVARLVVGPRNARLLPLSACIGGLFLLLCDGLARTLFVSEIPIGIVTELLGVPGFLCVLPYARRGWT